jgi:hypothetical protein
MENGREVRSTSLKYDDGQKATNSAAVRGYYPPLPRSGLVQRPLSCIETLKRRGRAEALFALGVKSATMITSMHQLMDWSR